MAYGFQNYEKDHMARAISHSVAISTRHSVAIANYLRGQRLQRAKRLMERAIDFAQPVPFTRFDRGMGHKAGMAAGSYPINASKAFLTLLKGAEANAQAKGLNTGTLTIVHIQANKVGNRQHGGRHGRKMKRTNIEVIVAEGSKEESQ
ncbi:MAG TPA: 50S ribosomal protein L22 [Candidatus Nanoarchaeia archaeon]|nr:50S ribosomal protein L22 [Candidatus Nanoarchaeia archaeon]